MNVSHELRTPLNAIYGSAQMLATGAERRAEEQGAGDHRAEYPGATQLIDDLVNASETAGGRLRLDVKDVDLAGVVRSVLDIVRPAIQAKRIALQAAIDDGLGLIRGDRDRLQQVVWHLLSNAIKFTPVDGGLAVHLERTKSSAQLTVNDSGAGIAPEFLPHVFEPFRQQDGSTTRHTAGWVSGSPWFARSSSCTADPSLSKARASATARRFACCCRWGTLDVARADCSARQVGLRSSKLAEVRDPIRESPAASRREQPAGCVDGRSESRRRS